ncbi:MAG TPA: hypothetical protein VFQ61_23105 [Polyangiaceae bacterium]|nr:hypothetical protein [Polyangiaceae bacterium]
MKTKALSIGLRVVLFGAFGASLPGACSVQDRSNVVFASGGEDDGTGGRTTGGATTSSGGRRTSGGSANSGGDAAGGQAGANDAGATQAEAGGGAGAGASPSQAGATSAGATGVVMDPAACAESLLRGTGKPLAESSTQDGTDAHKGSCGSGTGNDVVFDWLVPATDYYSINTIGSDFDTVLYTLPSCEGKELACNNNTGTSPQSEILSHFKKDERVLLVVDGNSGDQGSVALNTERITCPDTELTGQPLPATLSTSGGPNTHKGTCGGDGTPEKSYHWTAPQAGIYRFTASSTEFVPSLYVERGPRCGGELLGCSQASGKTTTSYPATVSRYLQAGQVVNLIVDGGSGFFTLDAKRVDAGTTCGTTALPGDTPVTLKDTRQAGPVTQSCGPAGSIDGVGSGPFPFSSVTYKMDVNFGQSTSCSYQVQANGPIVVSLIRGTCSGSEARCVASTESGGTYTAKFSLGAADNGTYTLLIQNGSLREIEFTLTFACIA